MLFRRNRPKIPSFTERIETLKQAGFNAETLPDGRVKISKNGAAAIVGDEANNQRQIERAGISIGPDIAILLNKGYQMFLQTSEGLQIPATAEQLKALHEFEEDVKDALGLVDLYNTSLGTTSQKHNYDRVYLRDTGRQPKPWERKDTRIVPPDTKGSQPL